MSIRIKTRLWQLKAGGSRMFKFSHKLWLAHMLSWYWHLRLTQLNLGRNIFEQVFSIKCYWCGICVRRNEWALEIDRYGFGRYLKTDTDTDFLVLQLSPRAIHQIPFHQRPICHRNFRHRTLSPPIPFCHRTLSPPINFHQRIFRHQSPFARGLFAIDPNSPPIKIIRWIMYPIFISRYH